MSDIVDAGEARERPDRRDQRGQRRAVERHRARSATRSTQLDQVTQQNAALVEESAAAAESLKQQAASLAQVVGVFKLGGEVALAAAARPTAPTERRGPDRAANVTRPRFGDKSVAGAVAPRAKAAAQEAVATRTGTDDWEAF